MVTSDKEVDELLAELDAEFGKNKVTVSSRSGSFPQYADLEDPLLCLIFFRGGTEYELHASDTYRPLADFLGLSHSERHEVLDDGTERPKWNNMVQWARRSLKKRGLLAGAGWGIWKLSDKGVMEAQRVQHKYSKLK